MQNTGESVVTDSSSLMQASSDENYEELLKRQGMADGPAQPKTLRESSHSLFMRLLPPIILTLVPICFLALGLVIYLLDQEETVTYEDGDAMSQIVKVAASAFQISFAGILGSFLHALALYEAERGTTIGILEKLLTSNTLGSTVKGGFKLRFLTPLSVGLVFLWSLSPAGAQGLLRAITPMTYHRDEPLEMAFHPNANMSIATDLNKLSDNEAAYEKQESYLGAERPDLMFNAAAFAPYAPLHLIEVKDPDSNDTDVNDPIGALGGLLEAQWIAERDVWDDVRIPYLEYLSGYDAQQPYAWVEVNTEKGLPVYESLVGMQITGLRRDWIANTTVQVEASYPTLNCSTWTNLTTWLETHRASLLYNNATASETAMFESPTGNGRRSDVFFDILQTAPARLAVGYASALHENTGNHIATCSVGATHLDLAVACYAGATGTSTCRAERARHSRRYPLDDARAGVDAVWPAGGDTDLANIPFILATDDPASSSVFVEWLLNVGLPPPPRNRNTTTTTTLTALPARVLNARLSYFLNTYWRLGLPGAGGGGIAGYSKYANATQTARDNPYYVRADGTASVLLVDVYVVRRGWLGVYVGASAAMLACAVAGAVLRGRVRAPDVLGGVAGLAWESRYVGDGGGGGSALDGAERAVLLRERWVRIQDVKPFEEVGRIALSDRRPGLQAGGLRWDRKYE